MRNKDCIQTSSWILSPWVSETIRYLITLRVLRKYAHSCFIDFNLHSLIAFINAFIF